MLGPGGGLAIPYAVLGMAVLLSTAPFTQGFILSTTQENSTVSACPVWFETGSHYISLPGLELTL